MAKSVGENFVCENVIDAKKKKKKKKGWVGGGVETKLSPTYQPSFRPYIAISRVAVLLLLLFF